MKSGRRPAFGGVRKITLPEPAAPATENTTAARFGRCDSDFHWYLNDAGRRHWEDEGRCRCAQIALRGFRALLARLGLLLSFFFSGLD